ncbi:MAG: hypothetical protein MZV65_14585 [Chromatiales bacterium]|nr:hypothetical protein [Chromatiales bacterium]
MDDLFLSPREMRQVLHGDRVRGARQPASTSAAAREGAIVEVLERANQDRRRPLLRRAAAWRSSWSPRTSASARTSWCPHDGVGGAKPGQIVVAEITEQPDAAQPAGRAASSRCWATTPAPGMEIEIALRKHDLPHEFAGRGAEARLEHAAARCWRRPSRAARTCATCRWSPSTARTRATSTTPCIARRRWQAATG